MDIHMIPPSRRLSPYKLLSRELPPDAVAPVYAETVREARDVTLRQNAGTMLKTIRENLATQAPVQASA